MIEMTLPDMSCNHCVRTVTETVQQLDPAARVDIDLGSRRARIESELPRERIAAALSEQGYPPDPAA